MRRNTTVPSVRQAASAFGRPRHDQDRETSESGAILVLALVYLVAVAITVTALTGWATNSLDDTKGFASARTLQDASRSAAELAIQNIRYTPMLSNTVTSAATPSYCWGSGSFSQLTIDGYTINAFCSTAWNPTSAATRVVTISACTNTALSATAQAAACAANPYLQVVVTFDDYPPAGSSPVTGSCVLYTWCGEGQVINSWNWS